MSAWSWSASRCPVADTLPVTEGFATEDERFNVAAKLGWLEGELRRANWVHHTELSRLTDILLQRIEDLEESFKPA